MRAGRTQAGCGRATGVWIIVAATMASSMAMIDTTVVNVALPAMQRDLDASVIEVQWIVEAYALFLAALILTGGMLGDLFGRRRIFMGGVALFGLSSVACALAGDAVTLIVARGFQGVGAALLVPGSLALIGANFSRERRGRAIGTWAAASGLAMAAGPVLGGWLVDAASWRWIFYINVPLALGVLAVAALRVPESRNAEAGGRIDIAGAALATLGLGGLVLGLLESGRLGFASPVVWGGIAGGAALLAAFVAVEARVRQPMLPLGLFRSGDFSGANLMTLFLYAALSGSLFYLPFNLIQLQGYSAASAGAALLPFIVLVSALSRWAGGLVDRFGGRLPLVAGPLAAACGFALLALPAAGGSYWTTVFPALIVLGLGMAVCVAPLTTVVMGAVGEERSGTASGINNAVARIAGLVAIAAFGVVILSVFNLRLDAALADIPLGPEARAAVDAERLRLAGAEVPAAVAEAQRAAVAAAYDAAFLAGYRTVMLCGSGLALLSALCAFLMIAPGRPGAEPEAAPA